MSEATSDLRIETASRSGSAWRGLWLKEDWWAIWLGLGLVIAGFAFFAAGSSIGWIAVIPAKWSDFGGLGGHFAGNAIRYLAQFALWAAAFSVALRLLGQRLSAFLPSFALVYLLSTAIFALGQWDKAALYNLEPPLVALVVGLGIANLVPLPRWLDTGFRVELYIKTGIVLLGATLPFTLVVWAGPIAILQASIVSIATFLVIFWASRRLGLDRQLAATLGAGGAVCGVSAAIAIAGAVGAKREYAPIAITVVILWAIVMIFALPLVSASLHLPAGVAGAWIGTSEFADAAGFAAAQTYAGYATAGTVPGNPDQAVFAFTLMKVVGRDVWIGIWALVLAVISTTRWEAGETGRRAEPGQIWSRFPKFVIGFLIASLLVSWATSGIGFADFNKHANLDLVTPIKNLRTWAFIFCFLSIGLTTRFRELAHAGARPFAAFSIGVAVNVALGYVLSVHVFAAHWEALAR